MSPSKKSLPGFLSTTPTTQFLVVFCILETVYFPLSKSHAIDPTSLNNITSHNLNTTLEKSFTEVRRLPTSGDRSWGINTPWEGLEANNLLNPSSFSLLPFVDYGECKRGWTYKIQRGEDLLNYGNDLECIFFSGITPSKVPLGPLYGTVLSILNTEEFDEIVNLIWWGKLIREVKCPAPRGFARGPPPRPVYLGWNNILRHIVRPVPFVARVGPFQEHLVPGEFYDGKNSFIIDYTQDFSRICNNFEALKEREGINIPARNLFPINQMVDALRLVGRQRDGGSIFLAKSYIRDNSRRLSRTVVYFYLVNYDSGVNPEFEPGQGLPPLGQSFSYSISGLEGSAK